MKFLIKLEDRINGNVAFVECPSDMLLEELCFKIKCTLDIPYFDNGNHSFSFMGKVYLPGNCCLDDYFSAATEYLPLGNRNQITIGRDFLPSARFRLDQLYTVKGSALTYVQKSAGEWSKIRCTLVDRII